MLVPCEQVQNESALTKELVYIVKIEKTPKSCKIPKKRLKRTSSKHIQEFRFVKIVEIVFYCRRNMQVCILTFNK